MRLFVACAIIALTSAVWADSGLYTNARTRYVPLPDDPADVQSLNGTWRFAINGPADRFFRPEFDDRNWSEIPVPSNWEMRGFTEPNYREPTQAEGLYRRWFAVPRQWTGKRIFLRFEGVAFGFECWIDGNFVGRFAGAFNRSDFDVTQLVRPGERHQLAVRAFTNAKGAEFDQNDDWGLSGIHRDVLLFAVGPVHADDVTITTDLAKNLSEARISVKVELASAKPLPAGTQLRLELRDPAGKTIADKTESPAGAAVKTVFIVQRPVPWNTEKPALYTLTATVQAQGTTFHQFTRRLGIRQVAIEKGVLMVNHVPVKLRGVNHHDLHPDVGRALSVEHFRADIELMKRGNINAVRTSHYPPHPAFLDLADQYGLYVLEEVPIGRGEQHLAEPDYQPILMKRAEATVNRDRNHPSIILWSVGNENPIVPLIEQTLLRVRELDPTRPRLLPGPNRWRVGQPLPAGADIAAPHYPSATQRPQDGAPREDPPVQLRRPGLEEFALNPDIKMPVLATEMSHSRWFHFEDQGRRWEIIQRHPKLAGGFVWLFQDLGIYRKSVPTLRHLTDGLKYTYPYPYKDENTVADSHWMAGTEGIMFADRVPKPQYWINRSVYAQVVVPIDRLSPSTGRQKLTIPVINRYEFTDLKEMRGAWTLLVDGKATGQGSIRLSVPPGKQGQFDIDVDVPAELSIRDCILRLEFTDWHGRAVYERLIRLLPPDGRLELHRRLTDLSASVATTPGADLPVVLDQWVRVARKSASSEISNYHNYNLSLWHLSKPRNDSFFLKERKVISREVRAAEDSVVKLKADYPSRERAGQSVAVEMQYQISRQGWIDLSYVLEPRNATDYFSEFGLALHLPPELKVLRWLGNGPHISYPGQTEADQRGIYRAAPGGKTDIDGRFFGGNRSGVDLAAVTDEAGNGLGFLMDSATISLEQESEGLIFTHVLRASGLGTKSGGMLTGFRIPAATLGPQKGAMRLVPLRAGHWPELFRSLLEGPQVITRRIP